MERLIEVQNIFLGNFEAKQDADNVTKADCEAVVVAMKAFTDCLPDGQEKQDALASVALLQVFCAFINQLFNFINYFLVILPDL